MVLTQPGYIPRYIDLQLEWMLESFGAVCIEGPKSCGKTWACLNHAESAMMVADPSDNFRNRTLLGFDVCNALNGERPHLIDEWQEFPSIWDAVRMEVDRTRQKGNFILTGSSTPVQKGIMHSGVGRYGIAQMRTMSLYESGDSTGSVSLQDLFDGRPLMQDTGKVELRKLIDLTVRGGWPGTLTLNDNNARRANRNSLDICIRDASRLEGRNLNVENMRMLVRSLARNESSLASKSKIISDMGDASASRPTTDEYLDALDRVFLINNQPPFDPSYRSSVRVGTTPKRHLADPSLAVAAMGLDRDKLMSDLNTFGFLFEALCERDLDIYAGSIDGKLMHYRDDKGREIDAVIELDDGRWGAFEIKLGTNQIDSAAENLLKVREYMEERGARVPSALCVICGLADYAGLRDDGVYVVPITALRGALLGHGTDTTPTERA